ncbi:MAG: cob(I)yrinic acid a,c-diamide adenosyltransferase [Candidatus Firestonebacteria bacterium]
MLKHGLIQIYTGDGKGKTTAALGQAFRAVGNGLKVCIFQFLKDKNCKSGELISAEKFKDSLKIIRGKQIHPGFTKKPLNRGLIKDINKMVKDVSKIMKSKKYDIIILDEINNCISDDFISIKKILKILDEKPNNVELILTGRNVPDEIIEKADLVTNMILVKHPYQTGIKARAGIEY